MTLQFQVNKQLTERRPITRRSYRDQATLVLQARDWMQQLETVLRQIGLAIKLLADEQSGGWRTGPAGASGYSPQICWPDDRRRSSAPLRRINDSSSGNDSERGG